MTVEEKGKRSARGILRSIAIFIALLIFFTALPWIVFYLHPPLLFSNILFPLLAWQSVALLLLGSPLTTSCFWCGIAFVFGYHTKGLHWLLVSALVLPTALTLALLIILTRELLGIPIYPDLP